MIKIRLPFELKRPVLACGADAKGAFALAKGDEAFLIDGFGDLGDLDNLTRYENAIKRYKREFDVRPKIIASDLHPGYHSTRFAETLHLTPYTLHLYKVQHHEAHVASAIVDNSINGRVIGVAFDGTGFGSDGNIWGGEFFVGDLRNFERIAHFQYIPMPGADAAVREPYRMTVSYLYRAFGHNFPPSAKRMNFAKRSQKKWPILKEMMEKNINSPLTSSAGRLFDAIGSLILSKEEVKKEAELPMELEKMALRTLSEDTYSFDIRPNNGILVVDPSKVIRGIIKDLSKDVEKKIISRKFHNTIANIILKVCLHLRKRCRINKTVLSGGVFQNRYLIGKAIMLLEKSGFDVYTHSRIPANDSGIPIGQIAIADARAICA